MASRPVCGHIMTRSQNLWSHAQHDSYWAELLGRVKKNEWKYGILKFHVLHTNMHHAVGYTSVWSNIWLRWKCLLFILALIHVHTASALKLMLGPHFTPNNHRMEACAAPYNGVLCPIRSRLLITSMLSVLYANMQGFYKNRTACSTHCT